jgi:hypothetical protein
MSQEVETQSNALEPSVDLGILVGLLLTDGGISKHKNSAQIEFTNKSDKMREAFKKELRKLFQINRFTEISHSDFADIKRIKVRNKLATEALLKVVPTFRTKQFEDGSFPNSKIPKFFFELQNAEICKILQAMFSADGSICLWIVRNKKKAVLEIKKVVKISCKHPIIRLQLFQLLKKLGFLPTLREINDEVVLFKKQDIMKFRKEIGFIPGVKVTRDSKNWEGFEKNQILGLAIKTFELKKKNLDGFKSKDEVARFLKSMVS